MLVVIAILAVLIGLLLPAAQKAREAANQQTAVNNLMAIAQAENTYFASHQSFLGNLRDLAQFGINSDVATGESQGYDFRMSLVTGGFVATAMPAVPGKTGMDMCSVTQTAQVSCSPVSNAGFAQRAMFSRIASWGAIQVGVSILGFTDGTTPEQIRSSLQRPSTVPDAFRQLDLNGDGRVSAAEIFGFADGSVRNSITDLQTENFWTMLRSEMALGAGKENLNLLPAVQLKDLSADHLCGNGNPGQGNQAPCPIFPEPDHAGK